MSYLLLEDGSRILLEDGLGGLLLEDLSLPDADFLLQGLEQGDILLSGAEEGTVSLTGFTPAEVIFTTTSTSIGSAGLTPPAVQLPAQLS